MKFLHRLTLLLCACSPAVTSAGWTLDAATAKPAPTGLSFTEMRVAEGETRAALWVVRFNSKAHTLAVMDNPEGAFDLGTASEKRGALAAVNGGYFHPDRTPLGLVVRRGAQLHPLERAKLLSGVLSVTSKGIAIQRAAAFKPSPAIREALQAGPFLVEGGKTIPGLNAAKSAARTVVFQDAAGRAGVLIGKDVSLAGMAEILATPALIPGGKITRALNLDGGSSTALWVRGSPAFYVREWKGVRNYLAIVLH